MSEQLARRTTVSELVRVYQRACADVREAFARIHAAEKSLNEVFTLDETGQMSVRANHWPVRWNDPEHSIEALKRDAWRAIVERLELRRMLSITRAAQLDQQLDRGELPDITVENVEAFAKGYAGQLSELLEESVREVYDWLRPRAGTERADYKTNSVIDVGRKVVLTYVTEPGWSSWHVHHTTSARLTALENVFTALDGKGSITKGYYSELETAIRGAGKDGRFETAYFAGRCFRNRNVHLTFKRSDLLAKFNAIAGGKNLRPAEAA